MNRRAAIVIGAQIAAAQPIPQPAGREPANYRAQALSGKYSEIDLADRLARIEERTGNLAHVDERHDGQIKDLAETVKPLRLEYDQRSGVEKATKESNEAWRYWGSIAVVAVLSVAGTLAAQLISRKLKLDRPSSTDAAKKTADQPKKED